MNKTLHFISYLTVILAMNIGLHWFFLYQVYHYAGLTINITFYWILLLLGGTFPWLTLLNDQFESKTTRAIYWIDVMWLGFITLASTIEVAFLIISLFTNIPGPTKLIITITGAAFLTLIALINTRIIRIKKFTLTSNKLKSNIRIAHLSDIHLGPIYTQSRLEKIVKLTNSLKPDITVITGDLFDGNGKYDDPKLIKPLNQLKQPVYFIFGNHDFYSDEKKVLTLLKTTKTKILRSQITDFKGTNIIGIDDKNDSEHVSKELKKIEFNKNKYTILLYHRPQGLKKCADQNIDLMLAGHTHGGQLFPMTLIEGAFNDYLKGMHHHKNSTIIVSQGIGSWGPPLKLGSRSEIILVDLKPKN